MKDDGRGPAARARAAAWQSGARAAAWRSGAWAAGACLASWVTVLPAVAQEPAPAGEPPDAPEAPPAAATPEQRLFDWTRLRFPIEEYAGRRRALLEALPGDPGVVLVMSAHGLSHGETFRQADDFLYLTGLELPSSVLAIDVATGTPTLFVPARDFRFESPSRPNDFPGRPLADDPELPSRSGIADVRPAAALEEALRAWERSGLTVYLNAGLRGRLRPVVTGLIPDWDPAILTLYHLQRTYPRLRLSNLYEAMARTRMVKTPRELEAMRRSVRATEAAIRAASWRIGDGVTERELEAAFEGGCKENGAQRIAFASIIKSGPNALWPWRVLASHYDRRNRAMHDGELVIFDAACEVDHYESDIGRTFPVSGRFSETQRRILRMEVAVADAIIEAVRPGVTLAELQAVAEAAIPEEHRRFMQTGFFFGHHIGLSAGDPALAEAPLEPGMVFTVEPWYYNHEARIAVFTEDEVLVTEAGAEILSSGLPRTPEGLERLMAREIP